MKKLPVIKIILAFFVWRAALFLIAFSTVIVLPNFGSRFPYWDTLLAPTGFPSWVWGFANFDGVHYLRLVLYGYEGSQYSQAFFPLYPILIKYLSFGGNYLLSGLFLSNMLFVCGTYAFYELLKIDFNDKVSFKSIILLLAFPTAFYFGSLYSEALFLFLASSSLLLVRKNRFLEAGFLAALGSATRIFGLLLIPVFIVEIYQKIKDGEMTLKSKEFFKDLAAVTIIPLGTILYMWYLKLDFGDPLYFLNSQPAFGAERSSQPFILLPQVLFRYLKMLISVPVNSWQFFSSFSELAFTIFALICLVMSFKKIRFSYWLFSLGCVVLPTLTGTLSSMPRYILMIFLIFPFIALITGKYFKLVVVLLVILQVILVSLFTRGYWVA